MNGDEIYGILLDKRAYDGNEYYELTRVGPVADLQTVSSHRDEVAAYLIASAWRARVISDIYLRNERTGLSESGKIYGFTQA